MSAPTRIVVTGARGFIGVHVCRALAAAGYEVHGASREEWGDLTAPHDFAPLFEGAQAVAHLANIAHAAVPEAELRRVNVEGTRRQAEQAAAAGVRRFVYLSSAKAAAPEDAYGRAKLAAEQALAGVTGLEAVVLRPPLVYGPGVKANFLVLMKAVARALPLPFAGIENRRSLVYVGNLCDAIIRCLEAPQAACKTYFVSDGVPVSTPDLVRAIARALGKPARLFPFPPRLLDLVPPLRRLTRSMEVDDSAIRRELGWRPPYTFEQGLRATADWYLAQAR